MVYDFASGRGAKCRKPPMWIAGLNLPRTPFGAYIFVKSVKRSLLFVFCKSTAKKPLALENRVDSHGKLEGIRFQQVAVCPYTESFLHHFSRGFAADKENPGIRGNFANSSSGLNPIQRRQTDVQQNQVRLQLLTSLDRF